ncbi:MAG: hypothetical protein M3R58_10765 [Pseudomonadota bacterium]|nr:hypothetical protein [Pseudomonadota bacterium]
MKDEVKARLQLAAARVRAAADRLVAKPAETRVSHPEIDPHTGYARSRIIQAKKR